MPWSKFQGLVDRMQDEIQELNEEADNAFWTIKAKIGDGVYVFLTMDSEPHLFYIPNTEMFTDRMALRRHEHDSEIDCFWEVLGDYRIAAGSVDLI